MTSVTMATTEPAADLLSRCQARNYRWPAEFGGFRATLRLRHEGAAVHGSVEVTAAAQVLVDLPGAGKDETEWVHRQLSSLAMHRRSVPPGDSELRYRIAYAGDHSPTGHPLGVEVTVGDPLSSTYRILDEQITEIVRRPPAVVIRVWIQERTATADGLFLPHRLVSTLADPQTGHIRRVEVLEETWTNVGGLELPTGRTVSTQAVDGVHVRSIELTAHEPC